MMSPAWMAEAHKLIGTREIVGPKHNPVILNWLAKLKAWWQNDETPWCGTFVAHCLDAVRLPLAKNWFRAKAWAEYGSALAQPCVGAILVFQRPGGGHVGFYYAEDLKHYHVLGGNQGNKVSIAKIEKSRCIAVRWPTGVAVTTKPFIVAAGKGGVSTNEA